MVHLAIGLFEIEQVSISVIDLENDKMNQEVFKNELFEILIHAG